jgi:tetratricopeptide (TPR) repeat protein
VPRPRVLLSALVTALVTAAAARDAIADQKKEAAQRRQAANTAFELGEYERAIEEFKAAYELDPDPRLFYNLGLSHMKQYDLKGRHEDSVQARDYFKRFLALVPATGPRKQRRQIEKLRNMAEQHASRLAILAEQRGSAVVEPQPTATATVTQSSTAAASLAQKLEPEPAPRIVPSPPQPEAEPINVVSTAFYAGAGAAVVGAIVTGIFAQRSSDAANRAALQRDFASANRSSERARSFALATDALLVGALVSAGFGLIFD